MKWSIIFILSLVLLIGCQEPKRPKITPEQRGKALFELHKQYQAIIRQKAHDEKVKEEKESLKESR